MSRQRAGTDGPFKGARLRALRTDANWTQDDVGQRLRPPADRQYVSKVEKGDIQPSIETTRQLADMFETSTDYLLGRTGEQGRPELTAHEALVLDALRRKNFPELFRLLGGEQEQATDNQPAKRTRRTNS